MGGWFATVLGNTGLIKLNVCVPHSWVYWGRVLPCVVRRQATGRAHKSPLSISWGRRAALGLIHTWHTRGKVVIQLFSESATAAPTVGKSWKLDAGWKACHFLEPRKQGKLIFKGLGLGTPGTCVFIVLCIHKTAYVYMYVYTCVHMVHELAKEWDT